MAPSPGRRVTSIRRPLEIAAVGLGAAVAALAWLAGCPHPEQNGPVKVVVSDNAGAARMDQQAIVQAAQVEGDLVWYTSIPDDAATALMEAFRKRYPFLRVHLHRGGTFDTTEQIEDEIGKGEVRADVLHVLDVGIFMDLRRRGELLRYTPPDEATIRDEFQEPGYWWAMRLVDIGLAYNSKLLPAARAPRTWEDLLRPDLKGKIGFKDATTAGTAYAEYFLLREKYGKAFWEKLARQQPKIFRSGAETMESLIAGEILVAGEMAGYNIYSAAQQGKPIVGVWPAEGVPFIPGPIAILARAPHPNAGRLFLDFTLSREGQELCRRLTGAYSARTDLPPLHGQRPLSSFHLLTPTAGWDDYLQKQTQLRAEFHDLFRSTTE